MESIRAIQGWEVIDEFTDQSEPLVMFYRQHNDEPMYVIGIWTWKQTKLLQTISIMVEDLEVWENPAEVRQNKHGVKFIAVPVVWSREQQPDNAFEMLRRWTADYIERKEWFSVDGYRNSGEFELLVYKYPMNRLDFLWRTADAYNVKDFFETFAVSYGNRMKADPDKKTEILGVDLDEYLRAM